MTPAARAQAAIDILDQIILSAIDNGPPADALVTAYFKTRRYAGSKDRRAVRDLVFRAIRHSAKRPLNGRAAMIGVARQDEELAALFDGSPHAPEPIGDDEPAAAPTTVPQWLWPHLSPLVTRDEWPALLDRAPLDLRVHAARADRAALATDLGAEPTRLSPWGLRLPPDTRIDDQPAFADGRIEVQDEGSQLIALACQPRDGDNILDLCAGAGGKSLALAAAAPQARIIASDTVRPRLAQLGPRAERAGATNIMTRLLDGGREAQGLADLIGQADTVLVDAPCSGSGTWRRNPEGRWRLTPQRLQSVTALQAQILDLAAPLVRPGGALVYAVCSILADEGAGQAAAFLSRHSGWTAQTPFEYGRTDGPGRLLTPAHDRCDGFFVARLVRA